MRPDSNQVCENCGKNSAILLDARVKLTDKWPKGHWVFLCPECHIIYGIGFDVENVTVYQKIFEKVIELRKAYKVEPEVIKSFIGACRQEIAPTEEWKLILIGEIAYQLSSQNELIKSQNEYLNALIDEIRKPQVKPNEDHKWCKCGHCKDDHKDGRTSGDFCCTFKDCLCLAFEEEKQEA